MKVSPGDICRDRREKTDVETVRGTRQIHAVVAMEPYQIKTRRFSCFCQGCLQQETCVNKGVVDAWQCREIKKRFKNSKSVHQDTAKIHVQVSVTDEEMEYTTTPVQIQDIREDPLGLITVGGPDTAYGNQVMRQASAAADGPTAKESRRLERVNFYY